MPERRIPLTLAKTMTFASVGQVLPDTILVPADADWCLVKVTYTTSDNVNPQALANGGGLIWMKDSSNNNPLMDNPVALDSFAGRAQDPAILCVPYCFPRAGTIELQLTNAGTATQSIRLALHGYKVFAA